MTRRTLYNRVWYHGSPEDLTELATGSTITPNRALARAFSHKPTLVCLEQLAEVTTVRAALDQDLPIAAVMPHLVQTDAGPAMRAELP